MPIKINAFIVYAFTVYSKQIKTETRIRLLVIYRKNKFDFGFYANSFRSNKVDFLFYQNFTPWIWLLPV